MTFSVVYLEVEEVITIHDLLIEQYGGIGGLRGGNEGYNLVASAVERPRNKAAYEGAEIPPQAAALMFGLAKNHGFVDGNKRVALAATNMFLRANGWRMACTNETIAEFLEGCSRPSWTEDAVSAFVRRYSEEG